MIIHKLVIKDGVFYYLCNQAYWARRNKYALNWNKVTCKNCLKRK